MIPILVLLLFLSSCGGEKAKNETDRTLKPTDVKITVITGSDIKDEYTLPGIVEAWEVISASTELSGHVRTIYKKAGDTIKPGEPIVKLNTPAIDASLQTARIQLDSAKKEFQRAQALRKQGSITQKAYEDSQDHLSIMEVNYTLAKAMYDRSFAISPIDGIVDEIMPEIGELVTPGEIVARVIRADRLKIYLNIPEKDIPYIKQNQEVYIDDSVKATVGFVSTISNPQTLTFRARVDTLPGENMRAGRIVRVTVLRKDYKDAIVIPIYSITDIDGRKVVYVEENGVAKQREVKIDTMIGINAVINSGLRMGDRLVTTGQQFLSDGLPVRIVD
jgi:membrane fusion protein (multidrug efflux system)